MTSALTLRVQARSYERRWWILAVLCFSLLVIVLDNSILNVAFPTIVARPRRRRTASSSGSSTPTRSCSPACCSPPAASATASGAAARCSSAWSCSASARCASAFANIADQLIATRAFMGIGGAFIMPATLSIITNVFPPGERGKAIGVWAGIAGLGGVLGPITGGFLLEHFYWGSVFLVNLPIVDRRRSLAGVFLIPTSKDPSAPRLDPLGAVLSIVGLVVAALRRSSRRRSDGWTRHRRSSSRSSLGVVAARRVRRCGSATPTTRCSTCSSSRTRASPPRASAITLIFFAMFGSIVPAHPVLPVRARLLAARDRRPASCPWAAVMMIVVAAERAARRALRHRSSSSATGLRSSTSGLVSLLDAHRRQLATGPTSIVAA